LQYIQKNCICKVVLQYYFLHWKWFNSKCVNQSINHTSTNMDNISKLDSYVCLWLLLNDIKTCIKRNEPYVNRIFFKEIIVYDNLVGQEAWNN
jgi:hypothetical protein